MIALVKALAYAFPAHSSLKAAILKQLALLAGAGLLISIFRLTYGVDLSFAFF
jgi:hypothetical protein